MIIAHSLAELRGRIGEWKRDGARIAFVPTMGNLHAGHLSLIEQARRANGRVVASIFVNPMQFGPDEDLDRYPRTLEQDRQALQQAGCDLLYLPTEQDLYPQGLETITRVHVPGLTDELEGASRPGHFDGVATVVLKLFERVQPDIAIFGKKDYQQWRMIEKMTRDLDLPLVIHAGETIRETDGLAMSSRNQYLTPEQRRIAPLLQQQLRYIADTLRTQPADPQTLLQQARARLEQAGFAVDYLEIRERNHLSRPQAGDERVVLAAARLGSTRLIDNIEI
jgi:pantoate--beta-alanine ligase